MIVKGQAGVPVELKSRFTNYPEKQRREQQKMCDATHNGYVLIKQLHKRNRYGFKLEIETYKLPGELVKELTLDLEPYIA